MDIKSKALCAYIVNQHCNNNCNLQKERLVNGTRCVSWIYSLQWDGMNIRDILSLRLIKYVIKYSYITQYTQTL